MTAATTDVEAGTEATVAPVVGDPRGRWALFGVVGGAVAIFDQLTKAYVDANYELASIAAPAGTPGGPTEFIGNLVRIAKGYNHGGIFGLLGNSAVVLGVASLVVIALIVFYERRHGPRSGSLLSLTLGLLLGGAIGNLIDRFNHGYVVDFLDTGIGATRWYTFNVADAAVSVSIVALVALSVFGDRIPGGHMDDG